MGENCICVFFFFYLSERLTALTGSRHSASRCCVCFALPRSSSVDRVGAQTPLQHRGRGKALSTPNSASASSVSPVLGSGHGSRPPWELTRSSAGALSADVWQVLALPTLMPHAEVCELHFQSSVLVRQAVSSLHCLHLMLQILNGSCTGGVSLAQDPLHLLHHRSLQHSTIPCYQPCLTT